MHAWFKKEAICNAKHLKNKTFLWSVYSQKNKNFWACVAYYSTLFSNINSTAAPQLNSHRIAYTQTVDDSYLINTLLIVSIFRSYLLSQNVKSCKHFDDSRAKKSSINLYKRHAVF